MSEMKIQYVNVSDLIPYEKNPRKNDEAVKYVAKSIEKFGFKVPIVIDKNNTIVAGHTRYKAAQQLGLDRVPCIIADDLTPAQIKAFRIADNKTSEKSSWDSQLLGDEIKEILADSSFDVDMRDFGFGDFEITILTEDMEPEPFDDQMAKQYSENGERLLLKKRVMIVYSDPEEDALKKLLGLEKIDKVVYDISELIPEKKEE